MNKKRQIFLLVFLIILLFAINYPFLDKSVKDFLIDYEIVHIDRVIDGDTFVTNNQSVRLLGINSPEKGELYYDEAKELLELLVLNETVRLEFGKDKYDRYNRILAYVFLNGENINLKLVEKGLANYYFPSGRDRYYNDFEEIWNECIKSDENLCKKSEDICSECIRLKSLDFKNQEVIFHNSCDFTCDLTNWIIKDEGRKKFTFPEFNLDSKKEVTIKIDEGENNEEILFWEGENYVWTTTGDTLFLRDKNNSLVLWESY